ncbi:hypothetical protein CKO25_05310 [Thiocapsa imhoffii]|uniref:Uncharacterized protein n=2 Tax=Thiocapsa imhoffii TaxID=382777 RepID=A0A9X0WGB2_9GAMM|nr:hypothetical protein [Thiocapsa imhoffii]
MTSPRGAVPACAPRRPGTAITALTAALLATLSVPLVAAEIATSAQFAWSENAGWLNLKATGGDAQIYSDHLEGYAWHENLGWIRLGTHTGGGPHTYGNSTATNYGVNRDSLTGALSGYAWSENAGWINFGPTDGGVTAKVETGDLDGYAWSENVGWVRFAPYATIGQVCGSGIDYTPESWHMLALPCLPSGETVAGTFGDGSLTDLPTSGYSVANTGWALFKRTVTSTPSRYDMLPGTEALVPGAGYWFKSYIQPWNDRLEVTGTPTPVAEGQGCTSPNGCVAVPVQTVPGQNRYNLVGNPFPYPIDWAKVRVRVGGSSGAIYTPSQAAGLGDDAANPPVLSNQIWLWNGNSYDTYADATPGMEGQLRYFTSFWVNVLPGAHNQTVELLIPARLDLDLSQTQTFDSTHLAGSDSGRGSSWFHALLDWLLPTAAADPGGRWAVGEVLPGRGPEERPLRGWARQPALGPAPSARNPDFDLLVTEGIWTQSLEPKDARHAAHRQARFEGREWFVRLKVDEPATGFKDHNNVLGQLLTALDGPDQHDLIELPPYAAPWLTLVFPRPAWGARAGDYASDFRAAQRLGPRGRVLPGLPAGDWPFEIRADRPGGQVVLRWEGDAAVLGRSRLIDHRTRQIINPTAKQFATNGYPVTLTTGSHAFTWRFLGGVLPAR